MREQVLFSTKTFVFVALVVATYVGCVILFLFLPSVSLHNILGLLSLLCYTATIIPSILIKVVTSIKTSNILRWFLINRRFTGVAAFSYGLNHSILLILEKHLNLFSAKTYIDCFTGFIILAIFTFLAITSNDYSVKSLKANWKKLHKLTYIAIFILPWHILDKMQGHWSYITSFAVAIATIDLALFIKRKSLEQIES